jgi:hypothetical protein
VARRDDSAGCGCFLVLLLFIIPIAVALATWLVGAFALTMAAPAIVPYLLLKDPAEFQHAQTQWLVALAASPVLSYLLATARPPGRFRARTARDPDDSETRADRWARRRRRGLQTILLLSATSATAVVMLLRGNIAHGPHAFAQTMHLVAAILVTSVLLPLLFRAWDYWYPPIGEAVTVEAVRKAAHEADRQRRRADAETARLRQMLEQVERQLQVTNQQANFGGMCQVHFESFRCADAAHHHYESVRTSARTLSRLEARARASARPRLVPLREPGTGRRRRPDRMQMRAATAGLREHRLALNSQAKHGLNDVQTLNGRTAVLRDTIRQACGDRGQQWYDALERRKHDRVR